MPNGDFPLWLRRRREEAGLTQEQAAARAGVDGETWGRWERGLTAPQPRNREAIGKALGLKEAPTAVRMVVVEEGAEYTPGTITKLPLYTMGRVGQRRGDEIAPRIDEIEVTRREAATADAAFHLNDRAMAPRFLPGDVIGVRLQQTAEPGQLVIAQFNQEIVFRRYEGQRSGASILTPLNTTDHQPIVSQDVEIIGVLQWYRGVSVDGKL